VLPYTVYLLSPLMFISASDKKHCAIPTNTAKKKIKGWHANKVAGKQNIQSDGT